MKLKSLLFAAALISAPVVADDCLPGFGPGCVIPPGPAPTPERIPIPGLTDEPEKKPAGPKKPEEVPNLAPPKK